MFKKWSFICCCYLLPWVSAYGWNALGHRLIAQIAYDNMTPVVKQQFEAYEHALSKVYKPLSITNAAVWLDTLNFQGIHWYAKMHYIDVPFSTDGTPLPGPQEVNAQWAINNALHLLSNKYAKTFDKGVAFRILLHVVGDLHQPLHAATQISAHYPQGDQGGNLLLLKKNKVAKNLHAYWDKGAGLLTPKPALNPLEIEKEAVAIEKQHPCDLEKMDLDIKHWTEESHQLALSIAYAQLPLQHNPDKTYQRIVQKISHQRIALAGCRLAALLNRNALS